MTAERWTLDPAIDAFLATMELPPKEFMAQLAAERAPIEAAAPKLGESAPEFTAKRLSADGSRTGESVKLADFRGEPLALLFGNYTCPVYRGQIERFDEIYAELHERLNFLLIYTREAHPEDGWQVGINHDQDVVYHQPTTVEARAAIASTCMTRHDIRMPVALDDMGDSINKQYSGSPERLYLIDGDGIVRHRSGPGPFKLATIEAWHQALKMGSDPI